MTKPTNYVTCERILEKYYLAKYADVSIIFDNSSGYINATHLCASISMRKKDFAKWRMYSPAIIIIRELASMLELSVNDLIMIPRDLPSNSPNELRGHYVHPELIPYIVYWANPTFSIYVTRISNAILMEMEIQKRIEERMDTTLSSVTLSNATTSSNAISCIYFISCGDFTKIGYTDNLPKKFSTLQLNNKKRLSITYTMLTDSPAEIEKNIHNMFEQYKVSEGWFVLPENAIELVKQSYE